MTSEPFELADGTMVPVTSEYHGVDFTAYVLRHAPDVGPDDYVGGWIVTWTDGINWWFEDDYELPWHALARFAALVAACEQQVFLVHDLESRGEQYAFVEEAERFVSRTVHASSCPPDCDGTDPANHAGFVGSRADVWDDYWRAWCEVNETTGHPHDEASPARQEDLVNWLLNNRV